MTERKGLVLLIGALAAGSLVLTLVMTSSEGYGRWSRDVDQVVSARDDALLKRYLKVRGTLVERSLRKRQKPCEYRFELTKGGARLPVRYAGCVVPEGFRDVPGLEVTVEGELDAAGHFEADEIMVWQGKYESEMR